MGRFRTSTNDRIADVEVPGGTYEVGTWKNGYEVVSKTVAIASDRSLCMRTWAFAEPAKLAAARDTAARRSAILNIG